MLFLTHFFMYFRFVLYIIIRSKYVKFKKSFNSENKFVCFLSQIFSINKYIDPWSILRMKDHYGILCILLLLSCSIIQPVKYQYFSSVGFIIGQYTRYSTSDNISYNYIFQHFSKLYSFEQNHIIFLQSYLASLLLMN